MDNRISTTIHRKRNLTDPSELFVFFIRLMQNSPSDCSVVQYFWIKMIWARSRSTHTLAYSEDYAY